MKRALKQLYRRLVRSEGGWAGVVAVLEAARRLRLFRGRLARYGAVALHLKHDDSAAALRGALSTLAPDGVVVSGVFEGLRYPEAAAYGGTLAPKLLGLYERELAPFFVARADAARAAGAPVYAELINIGSAEGYYAIGALRAGLAAEAVGYDVSQEARLLALAMARANGVETRYAQRTACDRAALLAVEPAKRRLVICDCEGAERALFDAQVARRLACADVVIEVHEHLGASLRDLIDAFAPTHHVSVIPSISDRARADAPGPAAFTAAPLARRLLLAAELRAPMSWLIAEGRADRCAASEGRSEPMVAAAPRATASAARAPEAAPR